MPVYLKIAHGRLFFLDILLKLCLPVPSADKKSAGHAGLSLLRNTEFFQDEAQWAEFGKTELEEIKPDK